MSDYPDFEDIIGVRYGGAIAYQRLMDRLKAIESGIQFLVSSDQQTQRRLGEIEAKVDALFWQSPGPNAPLPEGFNGRWKPESPTMGVFRGNPVKTPEEIDGLGLPPEPQEEEKP